MFAKLLKHEWKTNSKMLITISGFMLGIALLSGFVLRLLISAATNPDAQSDVIALIAIPASLFLFVAFLALVVYAAGVEFYLLYRFYKSRFTDEGYLTFTLPVKTSHIFLSSALHMLIWGVISGIVLLLSGCICIFVGIPFGEDTVTIGAFFDGLREIFSIYAEVFPWEAYLPVLPVTLICGIVLPMSCIVIGSVLAKKLKILASIGIMYGCSALTSVISGMITAVTTVMFTQGIISIDTMNQIMPISSAIISVILASFGYLLSIHLMKNKLNLP